jgi:hypothetical protein
VGDPRKDPAEFDVFVCCADSSSTEMPSTVAAYLRRRGFRAFLADRSPTGEPDDGRIALIEAIPDFLILLTPSTVAAIADPRHGVRAEIACALSTGRNVILVAAAGAAAPPAGTLPAPLA